MEIRSFSLLQSTATNVATSIADSNEVLMDLVRCKMRWPLPKKTKSTRIVSLLLLHFNALDGNYISFIVDDIKNQIYKRGWYI